MELPLSCIVCGFQPEACSPGADISDINHPYAATAFTSHGHYGSTIFDPMDGKSYIEINVCDTCLRRKAEEGVIGASAEPNISLTEWVPHGS